MPSTTSTLIAAARRRPTRAMTEPEAKAWLAAHGLPLPEGRVVHSAEEAAQVAQALGFPVVLKVVSPDVLHKSDAGGVRVGLPSADAVRSAFAEVVAAVQRAVPTAQIDGLLVERMAPRGHEFIVGLQRDPVFGLTLLVGAGGLLVELLRDVSLRVVPISERDAQEMLAELRSSKLLDGFRGVPPGDRAALVRLLLAIGGPDGLAARAGGDLAEMDLNPVLVHAEGLSIVDARVIVTPAPQPLETPAGLPTGAAAAAVRAKFQPVFYPRAVVIVGASTDETKMGSRAVRNIVEYGFKGPVYPINPRAKEIYGVQAYPSIGAIPGPADRAVIAIPAEAVPAALVELAGKGVKVAQVLTAGYGEAGPEGRAMERALVEHARRLGVRIIGPNCVGTYCPEGGISLTVPAAKEAGPISMASQSGGLAVDTVRRGGYLGVRFSKVISAGNCADVDLNEYLEYFGIDPDTKIVVLYAEGLRDGARFRRLLEEVAARKAIVVLKGGRDEMGARAAASHTGALASDFAVWQAVFRQANVITVDTLEELVETLQLLQFCRPPAGRGVCLLGNGGGATVTATDAVARAGLTVPRFRPETERALEALGIPPGSSVKNPIDSPTGTLRLGEGRILADMLRIAMSDPQIDSVVVHLNLLTVLALGSPAQAQRLLSRMVDAVCEVSQAHKPLLLSLRSSGEPEIDEVRRREEQKAIAAGVPVYPSLHTACEALARVIAWRERQEARGLPALSALG